MMMPSIFREDLWSPWDDFALPDVDKVLYGRRAGNMMKTDIKQTDSGFEVAVELPGFEKDQVEAVLEDGYLTVKAAKGLDKETQKAKGKFIRRERYEGSMSRSFFVGENVTQEDIHARYENGVLMLEVLKKAAQKEVERKQHISIEG